MKAHKLANLFPEMTEEQFASLKESIQDMGQANPNGH